MAQQAPIATDSSTDGVQGGKRQKVDDFSGFELPMNLNPVPGQIVGAGFNAVTGHSSLAPATEVTTISTVQTQSQTPVIQHG